MITAEVFQSLTAFFILRPLPGVRRLICRAAYRRPSNSPSHPVPVRLPMRTWRNLFEELAQSLNPFRKYVRPPNDAPTLKQKHANRMQSRIVQHNCLVDDPQSFRSAHQAAPVSTANIGVRNLMASLEILEGERARCATRDRPAQHRREMSCIRHSLPHPQWPSPHDQRVSFLR